MPLSAPMAAALAQSAVLMSYCVELQLPGYALRLTDGGFYNFPVDGVTQTFVAKDDTYGVLGGISPITDGVSGEAASIDLVILAPTNAAVAALAAPAAQGSLCRLWVLVIDPVTNAVIGTPERWFKGTTNVPSLDVGDNSKVLSISVNSVLFAAKQADEGARLNDGFHQRAWPGERGLEYGTSIEQVDYWGSEASRPIADYSAAQRRMLQQLGVKFI